MLADQGADLGQGRVRIPQPAFRSAPVILAPSPLGRRRDTPVPAKRGEPETRGGVADRTCRMIALAATAGRSSAPRSSTCTAPVAAQVQGGGRSARCAQLRLLCGDCNRTKSNRFVS
jgi:hypothetical protein